MVRHPIHVGRQQYGGADAKKRAKVGRENGHAHTLEECINRMLLAQKQPICVYDWMEISQESGIPYETVKRLGYSIDGGSNGFTAVRHDLAFEEAWALHAGKSQAE